MPVFTYPKSHRLRSKQDFQSVYQKSFRIVGDSFLLRIRPNKGKNPRLGVMVSKKFGGAPYRNRVRRVLRELFRLNLPALPVDVHFSQIRPFSRWDRAKKELRKLFAVLQDGAYLKMHLEDAEMSLKNVRLSPPMSPGAKLAFGAVFLYKRFFSSSLPPGCRFLPTCSVYAMDAFRLHGFFKGFWLSLRRILRCHPLGGSGFDPVPGGSPAERKPHPRKRKK